MKLRVNEIFTSFQGEGRNVGMPCTFLRLAFCNLHCTWCDTYFAWNWGDGKEKKWNRPTVEMNKEVHDLETSEVAAQLEKLATQNLVITGGEPTLQQLALIELLGKKRPARLKWIEMETNGTIPLSPALIELVDQFNCSPKLSHSDNSKLRCAPNVLRAHQASGKTCFKFVIESRADLTEVKSIVEKNKLTNVYLMPLGRTKADQNARMPEVAEIARENGWHVTPRLHILMYGDTRKT
jgi:7-carboxy-7-deazaguanine synthase